MRKAILAPTAALAFLALAACNGEAPPPQGGGDQMGGLNILSATVEAHRVE